MLTVPSKVIVFRPSKAIDGSESIRDWMGMLRGVKRRIFPGSIWSVGE